MPNPVGGGDEPSLSPIDPPADKQTAEYGPVKPPKRECMNCAKLPDEERPKEWRPLDKRSGPRSPRCHTHQEAELRRQREVQAAYNLLQRFGMTPDDQAELAAAQGGKCPCGRKIKDRDHDHKLAKQHGHPKGKGCKKCMRGLTCGMCNRFILGRGYTSAMLRALADYVDDPPAQKLWGDEAA